jgi:hypothetical protein
MIFGPICFGAYIFFSMIITHRVHKRNINTWSNFNSQLLEWANEITDPMMKQEYLIYASSFVIGTLSDAIDSKSKIAEYRAVIYRKWGSHIPSLKQELRSEKLKKLI